MRVPFLGRAAWGKLRRRGPSIQVEASAEEMAKQIAVDRWRIAGASVTGVSHQDAGEPCDDAWFVQQAPNGFVIAVVSDGAGSAAMSAFAARAICDAFEDLVAPLSTFVGEATARASGDGADGSHQSPDPWSDILLQVEACMTAVRERLIEHAVANQGEPDDYLATVVGVIAHPVHGVLCFHVGDGAITVFSEDGEELLTSQPENGEYLNQTYFLVEEEWRQHFRVSDVRNERLGSIFLMTDGVTDLAYHRRGRTLAPEQKFFAPLAEFLLGRDRLAGEAGIAKVLDTERARQLVDDDKTLVWIKPA